MQARFYLPMYGRFASPDPARDQHFEQTQSWNIYSYVQNNPIMATDPAGMVLELKGNAVKQFGKAMTYLSRPKSAGSLVRMIDRIKKSKTENLTIWVDTRATNSSQGGEVQWNPTLGNATQTGNSPSSPLTGDVQSPAVGLAHELIYEEKKLSGEKIDRSPDAQYENKEEKRTTERESKIATELGEPTRNNHGGVDVRVEDATSRKPVEPPMIKKLEEAKK